VPKILLADDSTHAQRMGAKILSAEGFEVTTVSNGKAAIDSFKKSMPDLVVADIFMPGRNGYEVCQHVKTTEELKQIPVLLIIGAMEPYDPEEGKKAGADGVITKPLESSNLVTTVRGLLDAAKHFAPAKPKPKKEKTVEEAITTTPDPYAPVIEDPAWAAAEEEIITTNPRQEEIVIPQAISQQPVGMLSELLEPVETASIVSTATEEPPVLEPLVADLPNSALEVPITPAPEALEELFPTTESAPRSTNWVAKRIEVTPEDEKLFEADPAPPVEWGDLTQLAAAVSDEPVSAAALPWQTEPDLVQADTTPVEVGTAEGIEHFENLNETISSHAPISFSALGIGIQPIPLTPVQDEGPSMPSFDQEIILSPADVAAGAGDMAAVAVDPEFDRGFEPITSAMPLNVQPENSTPEAASPSPAEQVPAEHMAPATVETAGTDSLIEAAVAMVREATEKELAAEAAASQNTVPAPGLDPSTLEHVIRGVVGELMPQIVAQVKSALKH
jgi:CheY-like chemotaxis protein